ncbi:hypothetical protein ACHAXS_000348, partial [Conticribra weissflogii]
LPALPNDEFDESASIVDPVALEAARVGGGTASKSYILSTLRRAMDKIEHRRMRLAKRNNELPSDRIQLKHNEDSSTGSETGDSFHFLSTGLAAMATRDISYYSDHQKRQNLARTVHPNHPHRKQGPKCQKISNNTESNQLKSGGNNRKQPATNNIECFDCGPRTIHRKSSTALHQHDTNTLTEKYSFGCTKSKHHKAKRNRHKCSNLQLGRWILQPAGHAANSALLSSSGLNGRKMEWQSTKITDNQASGLNNGGYDYESNSVDGRNDCNQLEMFTDSKTSTTKSVYFNEKVTLEDKWKRRHSELKLLNARHGRSGVKPSYLSNRRLASWVNRQRTLYRAKQAGKETTLTQERIELMNELGFDWNPRGPKVQDPHSYSQDDTCVNRVIRNEQAYHLIKDFSYRYRHSNELGICVGPDVLGLLIEFTLSFSSTEIRKLHRATSSSKSFIDTKRKGDVKLKPVLSSSSSNVSSVRPIRPRFMTINEANH